MTARISLIAVAVIVGCSDGANSNFDENHGSDMAVKCDAKSGGCAASQYCDAPGCGAGVCRSRPTEVSLSFNPSCGCDGVTYWNNSQAHAGGVTVGASGACTTTAANCAALSTPCKAPANKCVNERSSCSGISTDGTCWSIPSGATCPTGAKDTRQCALAGGGSCVTRCEAILGDRGFAADSTCK